MSWMARQDPTQLGCAAGPTTSQRDDGAGSSTCASGSVMTNVVPWPTFESIRDPAATRFDDAPHDREPEPGSGDRAGLRAAKKRLERVSRVVRGHARCRCPTPSSRSARASAASGDVDLGDDVGATILDRVLAEVPQRLAQQVFGAQDVRGLEVQRRTPCASVTSRPRSSRSADATGSVRAAVRGITPTRESIEQIIDQLRDLCDATLDRRADRLGRPTCCREQLGREVDRVEWTAEIVRDPAGKCVELAIAVLELALSPSCRAGLESRRASPTCRRPARSRRFLPVSRICTSAGDALACVHVGGCQRRPTAG